MVSRLAPPDPAKPFVDERGVTSEQVRLWTRTVTARTVIIGDGNPEGLVQAEQGSSYIDENGVIGSVFYVKQKSDIGGDISQGWALIG